MRIELIAVLALLAVPRAAGAQSTQDLLERKPWAFEGAIGRELDGSEYAPRASAFFAGIRRATDDFGAWRLMGWQLRRTTRQLDGSGQPRQVKHAVTALALGVDIDVKIADQVYAEPFFGAGLATASANGATFGTQSPFRPRDSGRILVAGAALRYRFLTLQQHFVILHGAEETITEFREYYPFLVGVRF